MSVVNKIDTGRETLSLRMAKVLAITAGVFSITACVPQGATKPFLSQGSAAVQSSCETCLVQPTVEYVDVEVPECVQSVETVLHQPACKVCKQFSVSVRQHAGPGNCGGEQS